MKENKKKAVLNVTVLIYFIAALIGLGDFFRGFPVDFLAGDKYFYWGDLASNVSGYYAFRDTPWHFPIFYTIRLNYPDGLTIINTDSIPLAALFFKSLSPLLPPNFHFYGLWYGLVYVLQAVSAVYLIRQMGCERLWQDLLAACFALLVPAFIMRASHTALMTHAIVIFAIGLYFRVHREYADREPPLRWYAAFLLLIGATFLIHPYLTAMVLLIYWAALLDKQQIRGSWRRLGVAGGASIVVLTLVYIIFWYTPNNLPVRNEVGFGIYSMNLLAPFVGGRIIHWNARFLPMPDQAFEGLNYLGLGIIGLIILALAINKSRIREEIKKHKFLVIILLGLTIYSISNVVYAGQYQLFIYPEWLSNLIKPISNNFRASGRFFWPVGYMILFVSLFVILTSKKKWAIALTIGLLALQFYDVPVSNFPAMAHNEAFARTNYPEPIWDQLVKGKTILYLEPAWGCGGGYDQILPLQHLAARNRVLLNTAYASRQAPNCKLKSSSARNSISQKGTMHVFFNSDAQKLIARRIGENRAKKWCRTFSLGVVCVPYPNDHDISLLNNNYFLNFPSVVLYSGMGDRLPGDTGVSYLTSRIAREGDNYAGFLTRGPNIMLPAGEYSFQIEYHSTINEDIPAGYIEVFSKEIILDNSEPGQISRVQLFGSNGKTTIISGTFVIPIDLKENSLEIRIFWLGKGEISSDRLLIYRSNGG